MPRLAPLLLIALFSTTVPLAVQAAAATVASSFLACVHSANVPSDGVQLTGWSLDDCLNNCEGNSYSYAYYEASSAVCQCSATEPSVDWYADSASASSQTSCATSTDYVAYILSTTFQFEGCYKYYDGDITADSEPSTLAGCLSQCSDSPYTVIQADQYEHGFYCICQIGLTDTTASNCGPYAPYTYNNYHYVVCFSQSAAGDLTEHSLTYRYDRYYQDFPSTTASQVDRRRRRERLERSINAQVAVAYCPSGLTACTIPGSSDSFECIDTHSELESCGGCINGMFGQTLSNFTAGTDCTNLPGVSLGGVTCTLGQCQSSVCEDGYSLVDGSCAKTS